MSENNNGWKLMAGLLIAALLLILTIAGMMLYGDWKYYSSRTYELPQPSVNINSTSPDHNAIPTVTAIAVNPQILGGISITDIESPAEMAEVICNEFYQSYLLDGGQSTEEDFLTYCQEQQSLLYQNPLQQGKFRFFGHEDEFIDLIPAFAGGRNVEPLQNFDNTLHDQVLGDGISRIWIRLDDLEAMNIKFCREEFSAMIVSMSSCPPHESGDTGFTLQKKDADCLTLDAYSCFSDDEALYTVMWIDPINEIVEFTVKPQIAMDIDSLIFIKQASE